MGFQNAVVRVFTADSIARTAPTSPGVFGISNSREWLYVGAADNIQAQLLDALHSSLLRDEPTPAGFSWEACAPVNCTARCHALIVELHPIHQGRL
jgi:hypothetical protein